MNSRNTPNQQHNNRTSSPLLLWDAVTKEIAIQFPSIQMGDPSIDTGWRQNFIHVAQMRESGAKQWSVGFETPSTPCGFDRLVPNRDQELAITPKSGKNRSNPLILGVASIPDEAVNIECPLDAT